MLPAVPVHQFRKAVVVPSANALSASVQNPVAIVMVPAVQEAAATPVVARSDVLAY